MYHTYVCICTSEKILIIHMYYLGSGLSGTSVPPCGLKYSLVDNTDGLCISLSGCFGFLAFRYIKNNLHVTCN